jgi:hypothetical protein
MSDQGSHVFEPSRLAVMSMAMRHFAHLAAQEPDEWVMLKRQDFSAESYQSLVLLCLGGLTEQLVRQTHDIEGVRHVLRARVSGDYFKQFELALRHQAEIHFGSGHGGIARQGPEIEAIRLTEEGLAISEDDARFVLGRIQAGGPPSPGHIKWPGWETLDTTADSGANGNVTADSGANGNVTADEALEASSETGRDTERDVESAGDLAPSPADESHLKSVALAGFVGGADLADALGVHPTRRNAFFRQLERRRRELGDANWHEVREPRPNAPRFIYRVDSPAIRSLAAGYQEPNLA